MAAYTAVAGREYTHAAATISGTDRRSYQRALEQVFIDIDREDDRLSDSSFDEELQRELQEAEIAAAAAVAQRAIVKSTRILGSDQDEEMLEANDTANAA
jgi:hypothetical protein